MAEEGGTDEPQADLNYSGRDGYTYTPLALERAVQVSPQRTQSELQAWGLDPTWVGAQPFSLPLGSEFYRYQYDEIFIYGRRQEDGTKEYYPVEFRVWVNYVASPPPESLKRHFRVYDNARLQQAFDSGPYSAGQVRGFNFGEKYTNEETAEIAADEATNLGVPQFEVLIHQDGQVKGHAGGFFDPFALYEGVPDQEEWPITYNSARNDYEFRPQDTARDRLRDREPKSVYLNGKYIGELQPSRGTVYLSKDYASNDNTWLNSATGERMWSRQKFVDEGRFNYQAIQAGGKVYKVNESAQRIALVATKPDDWDPVPAEKVADAVSEQARMELGEATTFDIRFDQGDYLGEYDTPAIRRIEDGTDMLM